MACDTCGGHQVFYQCCQGAPVRRIGEDAKLACRDAFVWAETTVADITAELPALLCACEGGTIEVHANGPFNVEVAANPKDGTSAIEDESDTLILSGPDGEWATFAPIVSGPPGALLRRWRVVGGGGVAPILNGAAPAELIQGQVDVYGFNAVNGGMGGLVLPVGMFVANTNMALVDVKGAPHLTSSGLVFTAGASGAGKYRVSATCVVTLALASSVSFAILDPVTLLPLPGSIETRTVLAPAAEVSFSSQAIWNALAGSTLTVGWTTTVGGNSLSQQDVTCLVTRAGV